MSDQHQTGTDIAVVDAAAPTPRNPGTIVAGASPRPLIPQDFEGCWRIATAVCTAGMAPKGLDEPAKATVAILHGLEVGLTPMAALQSIAIVNGRPSIWGDGALALVRASGLLEDFEETVTGQGDTMIATCTARRRGQRSAITYSFGADDAKRAELWQTEPMVTRGGRNGSYTVKNDSPWYRYARRMLQMRARAYVLRDGFADVLRGLHIREEQEDVVRAASPAVETATAEPAQAARRVGPPPADEVTAKDETAPEATQEPAETVAEAAAGEKVADEAGKPPADDDFPGDKGKPVTSGDAGPIPDVLKRRRVAAPTKPSLTDEEREWIEGLDNAFSSDEDRDALDTSFVKLLEPHVSKFSALAVDKANELYNTNCDRIDGKL